MSEAVQARIYVIERLRHLEALEPGTKSWWCVEKAAVPGEFGVLYMKGKGMALLFRYIGQHEVQQQFCKEYGLVTGEVEILAKSTPPIHASVLRAHPVMRKLPALARSFQRKSFRLDEPFLTTLAGMMGWSATGGAT